MLKKILFIFSLGILFSNLTLINLEYINFYYHNKMYKNNIQIKNHSHNIDHKSFITPTQSNLVYYGRVLKYYYAYNFNISNNIVDELNKNIVIVGPNNEVAKQYFIQNIMASTINISLYGVSSDAEFFAEAFAKWVLTPDEQKNKSWEITNHFFIEIFPEIVKYGGPINSKITSSLTIEQKIIDIITNDKNSIKYDTTLASMPKNPVNLNYIDDNIIWNNWRYKFDFYTLVEAQIKEEFGQTLFIDHEIDHLLKTFIFDSYTKASEESINKFYNFNINYYKNFFQLDEKLAKHSKDVNNFSQIWFSYIFKNLEEVYLKHTPNISSINSEKWTKKHTAQLEKTVLLVYNLLYSILQNELWTQNLISAIVISPDFPLKGVGENTMGYTVYTHDYYNIFETWIVLSGVSLTASQFNFQYQYQWWSSPEKFSVLVHEYGHALDMFGSKTIKSRDTNYSKKTSYKDKYEGTLFGEYMPEYKMATWVIILIVSGSIIILSVIVRYSINFYRDKKLKAKNK